VRCMRLCSSEQLYWKLWLSIKAGYAFCLKYSISRAIPMLFSKKKLSFILLSASCCDLGGDEDVLRTKMPCQGDRSGRMGPYAESQHQNSISTHSMLAATCMEEEERPDSESEEADAGVSSAGRVPVVQQLTLSH
jgi:hypothetical protein